MSYIYKLQTSRESLATIFIKTLLELRITVGRIAG
jgi:hypothetical protein